MILVTFFFATALAFIYIFLKNKRSSHLADQFPGPSSLPILGNIFNFTVSSSKEAGQLFKESYLKYGEIYRFKIFHKIFFVISDPKVYEIILSSTTKYLGKSEGYELLKPWLGEGLVTGKGKRWHQHRKLITPAFHFRILEQFVETFTQQSDILVEKLKGECHKAVVDILPFVTLMTLDVVCETAMGIHIDAQNRSDLASEYLKALHGVTETLTLRITSIWRRNKLLFNLFAREDKKKSDEVLNIVHDFANKVIIRRRDLLLRNFQNNNQTSDADKDVKMTKKMAFLDVLLQSTIDGIPLTNMEIREEVDTFMFGGQDTTNASITFTLYLLSRHPDVQQKLVEEIKHIIGMDRSKDVTYQQLHALKYMDLVIKESLRLFPPVPTVGRFIAEDLVLDDGRIIPANSNIQFQFYMSFRNRKYFKDPEKYNPERFAPENMAETKMHAFAYTPFSAGMRNCIGQKYALLETKAVVSKVLRHFELLPRGDEPDIVHEIVTRSKNGIQLGLKPRLG